jgi:hypothetical protein
MSRDEFKDQAVRNHHPKLLFQAPLLTNLLEAARAAEMMHGPSTCFRGNKIYQMHAIRAPWPTQYAALGELGCNWQVASIKLWRPVDTR